MGEILLVYKFFKKFVSLIYWGLSSCKLCLIFLVLVVLSRLAQILAIEYL